MKRLLAFLIATLLCAAPVFAQTIVALPSAPLVASPQGRLTLVTGTPVLVSDQTAKSQVFYDCYAGNRVPYYDGTGDQTDSIAACEVSLTMATSSTGVTNSAGVFDIYWVHSGANRICVVTNGSGGGWASDTAGSNTARGTGYSAVHNTRGYWTNTNALTHCYNGATDYGPVAADQGTYLGSTYTTGAGQTGMQFTPAPTTGGNASVLGVWNAYNRVVFTSYSQDSTTGNIAYNTATWRAQDNSNSNRISYVDGLQQSPTVGTLVVAAFGTSSNPAAGIDQDSTTATPTNLSYVGGTAGSGLSVTAVFPAKLGLHYEQAVEICLFGSTCSFQYNAIGQVQRQILEVAM